MRHAILAAALLGVAAVASTAIGSHRGRTRQAVPEGGYELVPARSQLSITLSKAGWLRAFADNHLIIARQIEGHAQGGRAGWGGIITAPVDKLEVADPGRSPKDRQDIWTTMEGPDQLDAAHFPAIVWRLGSLTAAPRQPGYLLRGSFTLHGVTAPVSWPTHLAFTGDEVHVWGHAQLTLTQFGIHPVRRALGAVQVRNQFQLRWDTVWKRTPGSGIPPARTPPSGSTAGSS